MSVVTENNQQGISEAAPVVSQPVSTEQVPVPNIDNNVGEVSVYTDANLDDYDISLSTDVGEVTVNGRSYKRNFNQNGNGKGKIKIDTNVGEINLK